MCIVGNKIDRGHVLFEYSHIRCQNEKPFPIFEFALELVEQKVAALDIGSGTLMDVRRLIAEGFTDITAIDPVRCEQINECGISNVTFEQCFVEYFIFPQNKFDFVSALFVLPFVQRQQLARVLRDIHSSLKKGGIFVTTFLGENDFRAQDERIITLSEPEIDFLIRDMCVIRVHEFEGPGNIFDKKERVHIYRYVLRK
jgi:SAM-dependent methyltransferase